MTVLDIRQRDENTWYYVLDKKGNEGQLHGSKLYDWSQVSEILGEVPSYEEWQASEKYNKHLEEVIKVYERKDKKATETSIAYNELLEENAQLKEQINHLLKTQARQFVDNQKLQVKAEKAKNVVNIDTARQIKQLKELLKECKPYIALYTESNKHIGFTPETANLLLRIKEALK